MLSNLYYFPLKNFPFLFVAHLSLVPKCLLSTYTSSLYNKLVSIPSDVFDADISNIVDYIICLRMRYQAEISKLCQYQIP